MIEDTAWIVSIDNPERVSSYRYNAIIPANELSARVLKFAPDDDPKSFLNDHKLKTIVLCKPIDAMEGPPGSSFVRLTEQAKNDGVKVVYHLSDWHFDNPNYRKLSELCDRMVVQTKWIAEQTVEHFGVSPTIIEEPLEGTRGKPKFKPKKNLKLLWYGHLENLDTLSIGLQQLQKVAVPFQLSIVTNDVNAANKVFSAAPKTQFLRSCEIIPFTLEVQQREVRKCDVVLIPGYWRKDKIVKGHNRLLQSIHGGRIAAVFPLPQYRELEEYCVCHEDIGEGLNWILTNQRNIFQKIKSGQSYIDQRFAPSVVAAKWKELIDAVG